MTHSTFLPRRDFLQATSAAVLGGGALSADEKLVRVGVIGTGNRGTALLGVLLSIPGVEVPAVCDVNEKNLTRAQDRAEKRSGKRPEPYGRNERDYKRLLERTDLDAVVIASPWEWHTPMAVDAMKAGKYTAVEVPCALSIEECWQLVDTRETTNVPCMMLENASFLRGNLAVLNMIRQGMFGQMVHCHCAHSHDCIDHWFWDKDGNERWPAKYLVNYNRDQYPTHTLGPVLSWLDINCGDSFATLSSTATDSRGINAMFARKFGPTHPLATKKYKQGDIVTSVVRTHGGKTIVINYDMQLPRPYDNRYMVQGTLGLYEEGRAVLYVTGRSPKYHEWEPFGPYQEKYEHPWWRMLLAEASKHAHSGTDYLEIVKFIDAVRGKTETPIDVYDSVTMSAVVALSEQSLARGGAPVECPDFTRGRWRARQPTFAVA